MKYLVLGAGKMGQVACRDFLQHEQTTEVIAADGDAGQLATLQKRFADTRLKVVKFDANDHEQVADLMRPVDACLGAVHYGFNVEFTKTAIATGTHFCDLGGNNDIVREQLKLDRAAQQAGVSIIPDCGLAPGMVAVLAAWGLGKFAWADTVGIRVGGLPQNPRPPLNYSLLFSVEGLINEYVEPVRVLREGKIEIVEPLSEIETLEFPPPYGTVEAFTTSGGTSTLPETYGERLKNLDYKTIRYPGHGRIIAAMRQLGLFSSRKISLPGGNIAPRELTAQLLLDTLPHEQDDVTLVRVSFSGKGKQHDLTIVDEYDRENKITSMARMTAYPAAIVAAMQADGRVARTGVFPQEIAVPPGVFVDELAQRNIRIKGIE